MAKVWEIPAPEDLSLVTENFIRAKPFWSKKWGRSSSKKGFGYPRRTRFFWRYFQILKDLYVLYKYTTTYGLGTEKVYSLSFKFAAILVSGNIFCIMVTTFLFELMLMLVSTTWKTHTISAIVASFVRKDWQAFLKLLAVVGGASGNDSSSLFVDSWLGLNLKFKIGGSLS